MSNKFECDFRSYLSCGDMIFFDGGIGTMLQARGLPAGVSPELFCLEQPETLKGVHADYIAAGADVITTNTFGGNALKLPAGLDVTEFNRKMAALARAAADESGRRVFVAGSIGPTGKFLKPLGDIDFDTLVKIFQEQIRGLIQGGADLLQIETQIDITEARAAVIAARRECRLPVAVSMTYEDGVTLTGSSPEVCAATLANLGVDIIATNCSAGPEEMQDTVQRLLAASPVPVLIQPNAGLPELIDGKTVFRLNAERFAELTGAFAAAGARLLGGCCGTTPEHITVLRQLVSKLDCTRPAPQNTGSVILTSRSSLVKIGAGNKLALIGERINPTGKKQFSADLAAGELALALRFADEQLHANADILDVNVGAPLVDETLILPALISSLSSRCNAPLAIDSSDSSAIKAALEVYPASALVNSISGEPGRMEFLGPLCRDFGAPFILLPLKGKKLPVLASERIAIVEGLLEEMDKLNIPHSLAIIDILVLAVSSSPEAAQECMKFTRYCRDVLKIPTVAGLSNISFGLPARELVNSGFLLMAAGAGLSACIANPSSQRLQEAVAAAGVLTGQDRDASNFIENYADWQPGQFTVAGGQQTRTTKDGASNIGAEGSLTLESAVVLGQRENILPLVEAALERGEKPFDLVNKQLIPGITEVGARYERKEYFLPQLLRSAETMQTAFSRLKPLLEESGEAGERPRVILGTVEGDIHDIGKNIVNLMLGNHGFEVIDLGKDVSAEKLVEAAVQHKAKLIGLSALMTTTMVRMQDTIMLLKKRGLSEIKVIIGGAVVTQKFADSIGAHGYSADAVGAVRLAQNLLKN